MHFRVFHLFHLQQYKYRECRETNNSKINSICRQYRLLHRKNLQLYFNFNSTRYANKQTNPKSDATYCNLQKYFLSCTKIFPVCCVPVCVPCPAHLGPQLLELAPELRHVAGAGGRLAAAQRHHHRQQQQHYSSVDFAMPTSKKVGSLILTMALGFDATIGTPRAWILVYLLSVDVQLFTV